MQAITPELREHIKSVAWKYYIETFAARCSRGAWTPYACHTFMLRHIRDRILQGNARIIVNWPPRHGKSQGISHWLPTWFLEWYPEQQVILASYGDKFASKWGLAVRDEFEPGKLTTTRVRRDKKGVTDWMTTKGGGMISTSIRGTVTGEGFNLGLVDDPHKNWAEAQNSTHTQYTIDWFNGTFYTRKQPERDGGASIIVNQTRWSSIDLSAYLIEEHPDDWEVLSFPAFAEDNDLFGRPPGEPLCPGLWDMGALKDAEKAMPPIMWAAQYQQRPAPIGGAIIKADWIERWTVLPDNLTDFRQSWDLTFDSAGSLVVGQVWARSGADFYLVDQARGRWDFTEQIEKIIAFSKRWPQAKKIYIEKKANGAAAISTLKNKIAGIIPVQVSGDNGKVVRLTAVSGVFNSHNVYIPASSIAPWAGEVGVLDSYVHELVLFPNSKNDDQVDATSQVLNEYGSCSTVYKLSIGQSGKQESPVRSIHA